jgi:hypothetical protein
MPLCILWRPPRITPMWQRITGSRSLGDVDTPSLSLLCCPLLVLLCCPLLVLLCCPLLVYITELTPHLLEGSAINSVHFIIFHDLVP